MSEPHLKAVPDPATGLLRFEMDAAGFAMFERLLARSAARPGDDKAAFKATSDRVSGAFMAGAIQMGWAGK